MKLSSVSHHAVSGASDLEPFVIDIADVEIDDVRDRLRRTRFPADYRNDDWAYGTGSDYMRRLVDYWADEYDWRRVEAQMNRYDHFRATIDGVPVHFMRIRGKGPNPKPVLLSHGWPWTFWDFHRVIEPLTDPASYGGNERDALELIIPSLPGFGFSTPVHQPVGVHDDARILHHLMREVLGFRRFGAAGCDWGSAISAYLSHGYAADVIGSHMTEPHFLSVSYEMLTPECYGVNEEGWHERNVERTNLAHAHIALGVSEPQTTAHAFNDSPAGLAAWIAEKRFRWSDSRGDIDNVFTFDDICTAASIYWFTQSMGSSMRIYSDTLRPAGDGTGFGLVTMHDRMPVLEAPTGVAVFPMELVRMPRQVAERYANLHRWTVFDTGGHFSAFEVPEDYAGDVTAFFRELD
jgi:pimeloyl-ACP methyl ester carboxylesterase